MQTWGPGVCVFKGCAALSFNLMEYSDTPSPAMNFQNQWLRGRIGIGPKISFDITQTQIPWCLSLGMKVAETGIKSTANADMKLCQPHMKMLMLRFQQDWLNRTR